MLLKLYPFLVSLLATNNYVSSKLEATTGGLLNYSGNSNKPYLSEIAESSYTLNVNFSAYAVVACVPSFSPPVDKGCTFSPPTQYTSAPFENNAKCTRGNYIFGTLSSLCKTLLLSNQNTSTLLHTTSPLTPPANTAYFYVVLSAKVTVATVAAKS